MPHREVVQNEKIQSMLTKIKSEYENQLETQLSAVRSVSRAYARKAEANDVFHRMNPGQMTNISGNPGRIRLNVPVTWHDGTQTDPPPEMQDMHVQATVSQQEQHRQALRVIDHTVRSLRWLEGHDAVTLWAHKTRKALAIKATTQALRSAEGEAVQQMWQLVIERDARLGQMSKLLEHSEKFVAKGLDWSREVPLQVCTSLYASLFASLYASLCVSLCQPFYSMVCSLFC